MIVAGLLRLMKSKNGYGYHHQRTALVSRKDAIPGKLHVSMEIIISGYRVVQRRMP